MIEYKQVTKKAPLSFTGNKRNALKALYGCCKSGDIVVGDDTVIVDVFGGSGLLSNFFKQLYPNNTVIYNDYENYLGRLGKIPAMEHLRVNLLDAFKQNNITVPPGGSFEHVRNQAHKIIIGEISKIGRENIDIETTATWFRMYPTRGVKHAQDYLKKPSEIQSHKIPLTPIKTPTGYCEGVTVVKDDYKNILKTHAGNPDALFILDPPYFGTHDRIMGGYDANILMWLDLLEFMQTKGRRFIFFTSHRSMSYTHISRLNNKIFNNPIEFAGYRGKEVMYINARY